jgi:hypothetical protein
MLVTAKPLKVPQDGGLDVVAIRTCPVVPAESQEGMPPVPEINTPLFETVIPPITLADEEYKI